MLGIEVYTVAELDRRIAEPRIPDLVGYADIADMLGISKQRAAQLAGREDFPPVVGYTNVRAGSGRCVSCAVGAPRRAT